MREGWLQNAAASFSAAYNSCREPESGLHRLISRRECRCRERRGGRKWGEYGTGRIVPAAASRTEGVYSGGTDARVRGRGAEAGLSLC